MKNTPFQQTMQDVADGKTKAPKVMYGDREVDFFAYQVFTHHFYLKLMAKGMTTKQVKLRDLKDYYGLKGRTAGDVLTQFEERFSHLLSS